MDNTDREILQIIEKINSKTYIMKIKKYYLFLAINNYLSGDREKAKKFYLKIKEIDAPDPTIKFILKKLELPTP